MKVITLYRRDFGSPQDGDSDYFNDIVINLGLATSYDEAFDIDEIELIVEQVTITSN